MKKLLPILLACACAHVEPLPKMNADILDMRMVPRQEQYVSVPHVASILRFAGFTGTPKIAHTLLGTSQAIGGAGAFSTVTATGMIVAQRNLGVNFDGINKACGTASSGIGVCSESGTFSVYNSTTRLLLINPGVVFAVTDPLTIASAGGSNYGLFLTGPDGNTVSISTSPVPGFSFNNYVKTTQGFVSSSTAPSLQGLGATTAFVFVSNISAANAGSTPGSATFSFYPTNALDSGDYVFHVGTAANAATLFGVTYNGSILMGGPMTGSSSSGNAQLYLDGSVGARLTYGSNGLTCNASVCYQNGAIAGTNGSGTGISTTYSGGIRSWVQKVVVDKTAMAAAGTTDVTLYTTPVNSRIVRVLADVTQVFAGGALSAVAVTCGNAAGGNQYLLTHSQLTATNTFGDDQTELGTNIVGGASFARDMGTVASGVPGAIVVQCRYTCTGANCSVATTGSTTYYVSGETY